MAIRVIDLEKRHPGAHAPALRGLSLDVGAGRVAAVLGKSGAGKSTLLRCLVGLDPFDSGSVEIDGVTINAGGDGRSLLGRVGMVFQSFELFPHLSVLENLTLAPIRVRGEARASAEKRARELLEELGLSEKISAFPEALSGGQKQRVAIARALCMEPRVLLYDEPTSALDPSLKQEVGRTLRRVAKTGVTQIVVTHDIEVAREASDVVFLLEAGKVAKTGRPDEVLPVAAVG
ncbi:Glutamine transport ATP-binding protein GlnQ [Minicystis rosea]|nr:Glutamine transport ATP-binding protein GlnQ [Minicystis rosea]